MTRIFTADPYGNIRITKSTEVKSKGRIESLFNNKPARESKPWRVFVCDVVSGTKVSYC